MKRTSELTFLVLMLSASTVTPAAAAEYFYNVDGARVERPLKLDWINVQTIPSDGTRSQAVLDKINAAVERAFKDGFKRVRVVLDIVASGKGKNSTTTIADLTMPRRLTLADLLPAEAANSGKDPKTPKESTPMTEADALARLRDSFNKAEKSILQIKNSKNSVTDAQVDAANRVIDGFNQSLANFRKNFNYVPDKMQVLDRLTKERLAALGVKVRSDAPPAKKIEDDTPSPAGKYKDSSGTVYEMTRDGRIISGGEVVGKWSLVGENLRIDFTKKKAVGMLLPID